MTLTILMAAFILVPILELGLLLEVGRILGPLRTVLLVVFTGFVGAVTARSQGFHVVTELRKDIAMGRTPAPRLFDGVAILVAGVFLVTPGLITDAVGFLLLVPAVRAWLRRWALARIERGISSGTIRASRWRM